MEIFTDEVMLEDTFLDDWLITAQQKEKVVA